MYLLFDALFCSTLTIAVFVLLHEHIEAMEEESKELGRQHT